MGLIINNLSLIISQSIFLISFYLGCVILFYSEKKDKQAIAAGISFFICTLFFIGHMLVLGKGFLFILSYSAEIIYPSFLILSLLPFAWSFIVFRFYEDIYFFKQYSFRNTILLIQFLLFIFLIGFFFREIPVAANKKVSDSIFLIPDTVFYVYSIYILFCTLSPILFLTQVKLESNNLEQIAKKSAYRTIFISSLLLFFLSLLVACVAFLGREYLYYEIRRMNLDRFPIILLTLDLVACLSIMVTIAIVGRAVISYQVFTGRYLAMRSLKEYWKYMVYYTIFNATILIIGGLLGYTTDLKQVSLCLLGVFFIVKIQMISRKREDENRKTLRPFLLNENLYISITQTTERIDLILENTFKLLCDNTLETTRACLIPLGTYSSYIPKPLYYPDENIEFNVDLSLSQITFNENIFYLDRDKFGGYVLGITIQDKNETVGILFLGVKKDYTLYSEEEIEIARIGSGKILDLLSVAEISRLLVDLQKKQLTDSKLLDHQTRRVLHDDILPEIHSIMIGIDSMKDIEKRNDLLSSLSGLHKKISNLLKLIPLHPTNLIPTNFISEIKILVKSELADTDVAYNISEEAEKKLEFLEPVALEVTYYAIRELLRNISRYAKSPHRQLKVSISFYFEKSNLELSIEDNGDGFKATGEGKGAGQGLVLHSTMMAVIGGALIRESIAGESTKIRLILKKFFL